MLLTYLDESGTHKGANPTLLGGLIGPENCWQRLDQEWEYALFDLQSPAFHYTEMRAQTGEFCLFPRWQADALLKRLGRALSRSNLDVVFSSFSGDLNWAISASRSQKSLRAQFPSEYAVVFWMMLQLLTRQLIEKYGGERTVIILSRQDEHSSHALETWAFWRQFDRFPLIHDIAYEERTRQPRLDAADAVCYELSKSMFLDEIPAVAAPLLHAAGIGSTDGSYIFGQHLTANDAREIFLKAGNSRRVFASDIKAAISAIVESGR